MNNLEAFRQINTFIFDVDGVLTNSNLLITEKGELLRQMNIRDGLAIKTAVQKGYRVIILTGGKSEGVRSRLSALGVTDIYSGIDDKLETYQEIVAQYDLDEDGILYMGDDWPDYLPMRRVGLPCCPHDAIPEILKLSQYISSRAGGKGCARDVIEKVLKLHDNWMETD